MTVGCCKHRHWNDELVWSSGIYVLLGIISGMTGQWTCAILQTGAGIASTAFHRSKETKHLHYDALISSTLGIICIWSMIQVHYNGWYEYTIPITLHVVCSVFSWIFCGLPGGDRYDKWHAIWHYTSGSATFGTTIFLAFHFPEFDQLLLNSFFNLVQ